MTTHLRLTTTDKDEYSSVLGETRALVHDAELHRAIGASADAEPDRAGTGRLDRVEDKVVDDPRERGPVEPDSRRCAGVRLDPELDPVGARLASVTAPVVRDPTAVRMGSVA